MCTGRSGDSSLETADRAGLPSRPLLTAKLHYIANYKTRIGMKCAACLLGISRGELLACQSCKAIFHYRCLNMTTAHYMENKHFLMSSWCCPNCENITKRIRNDNTPTRKQHQSQLNDTTMSVDEFAQHDRDLFGDTMKSQSQACPRVCQASVESITLDKFSKLLETKLEEKLDIHKKSILADIKTAFRSEISQAINTLKQEMTQNTDALRTEQINIKEDINTIYNKIKQLETERDHLQTEMENIQKCPPNPIQREREENKTIVIYGLNEYYNDYEINLERRVINAFMNIMEIDLTGYIEGIQRIGKKGNRRPVQLELISKRMTKYILQNTRQFKSTGLYVSEFLDQKALQDRRSEKEKRYSSRQSYQLRDENPRPSTSQLDIQTQNRTQASLSNMQSIGGTFRF